MQMLVGLTDYSNPNSLGSRLRARRRHFLIKLIDDIHRRETKVRILDLGGERSYWLAFGDDYLSARKVHVTLVNYENKICDALNDPRFAAVAGDACKLSQFSDCSFDLVHSNSVIEHVGDWDRTVAFAAETRRLASAYYLQTPYFWFPIEPHFIAPFFHWLPESLRVKLMLRMNLGQYLRASSIDEAMRMVRSATLLDKNQLQYLLPDGFISIERLFFIPKSLIVTRPQTHYSSVSKLQVEGS